MSVTIIIIGITCIVSYLALNNEALFDKLKHNPYIENQNKEYYRMLTSGFVHGSWPHLLINMIVLYSFGEVVEYKFQEIFGASKGELFFVLLYLSAIVVADLPTFNKHKGSPYFSSVGASGAVAALLFASILFSPWSEFVLYFAIPVRAILFGVLYLIYSQWASRNQTDNVDHEAHFYGALYGALFTIALKPSLYSDFIYMLVHESPWW